MRRLLLVCLLLALPAGCGSSDEKTSASTAGTSATQGALTRARPGHPGDLTSSQRRSAIRACAPIRHLPAAPKTANFQASTAVAATLEQPTLATGAQLDRIARAHTRSNKHLIDLAQAFQQLATAYNALATVSHGNAQLLAALQRRAQAAAGIVALQARALGLRACVPRGG